MSEKKKKDFLMEPIIYALVGGMAVISLAPHMALLGYAMLGSGVIGLVSNQQRSSTFDHLFINLNLQKNDEYPLPQGKEKTDISVIYKFTLPAGISSEDFEKNRLAIRQYLGKEIDIKYTYKQVQIEVFNEDIKNFYPYEFIKCSGAVEFPVGYDRRGKMLKADLSEGEPHMLIAGTSGSGKSTVLRSIITNLLLDKNINLHLVDLKNGAEFQIFANCKKVVNFARKIDEAQIVLQYLYKEVDRRYDLFFKNKCANIKQYNKNYTPLPYELLIIDEFATLSEEKAISHMLKELSAKARACGIHMILSTQRPSKDVINGTIKANITTILGLKTSNGVNSRIIIDEDGLEDLRGKGNGLFIKGNKTNVQCPYLSEDDAVKLLKCTYVHKTEYLAARPKHVLDEVFEGEMEI